MQILHYRSNADQQSKCHDQPPKQSGLPLGSVAVRSPVDRDLIVAVDVNVVGVGVVHRRVHHGG